MKVDILDAHDRFTYLHADKHHASIGECCQNIIDQRPFGSHDFYIFAHKREIGLDERVAMFAELYAQGKVISIDQVPSHRILWQPRLTKPKAQTNSMLFKAYVGTDQVKVIWIIPEREMWEQYKKGNITESKVIVESIHDFEHNRAKLEAKEDDDLPDEVIDNIYRAMATHAKQQKSAASSSAS